MKSKNILMVMIVLEIICQQPLNALNYGQPVSTPISNYFGVKKQDYKRPIVLTEKARKAIDNLNISIVGDTVYLWSSDFNAVKNYFTGTRDGVYIDIVFRDKFSCNSKSNYDVRNISNGIMLKPVYFPEIYSGNRVKYKSNLYYPIACLPNSIKGKTFTTNIGFIYSGIAIEYREIKEFLTQNMPTLYLFPKYLLNKDTRILPDTYSTTLKFDFEFDRDQVVLSNESRKEFDKKMKVYGPYINKVNIKTYSSIEGTLEKNLVLQKKRADELSKLVKSVTKKEIGLDIESKENWDYFNALIKETPYAYLAGLSKNRVKELLTDKKIRDDLEYELFHSRTATLEINVSAVIDNNSPPELILGSYKSAIENDDTLKAYKAQNRLMTEIFKNNFSRVDLLNVNVPRKKLFTQLWTNYLALACTNEEQSYSWQVKDTAIKAITLDPNDKHLQFNFCILALRYFEQYHQIIVPIKTIEEKMSFCYKNMQTPEDTTLVNNMFLNYSLLRLYEANYYHYFTEIPYWLKQVKTYYVKSKLSSEEAIKLGLIYNYYYETEETCKLLLPYVRNEHYNVEALKLFVTTYVPSFELIPENNYYELMKKFKGHRPDEFYEWIDKHNFLYLQHPEIKNMFCQL